MPQFNRVYRLLIGRGNTGVELTDFHIRFDITKNRSKNPNRSKISIWNLKKSTREELEKPDTRCVLYAGYSEGDGAVLIFSGSVTFAWSRFDGPDVITELELADGAIEIRDTLVSLGYAEGVQTITILRAVAERMGLPLVLSNDAPSKTWSYGFTSFGPARTTLDKVCRASGLEWSIQNQQLQVIRAGGKTSRKAYVFAKDSGLVSYPERQREGAQERAKVTDQDTNTSKRITSASRQKAGWKFESLLVGSVLPGDEIILESRTVEGTFVVDEIVHRGDNWEGDWRSEITVIDPVSASPSTVPRQSGTRRRNPDTEV